MQIPTCNPTLRLKPDRDKSLKHTQTIPWLLSVKSLNEFGNAVLSGIEGNKNFTSTKVYLQLKLCQIEIKIILSQKNFYKFL